MVATEPVELQARVEDEDPEVNIGGLEMLGIAVAWGKKTIVCPDISEEEREGLLLLIASLVRIPHLC